MREDWESLAGNICHLALIMASADGFPGEIWLNSIKTKSRLPKTESITITQVATYK
jgi:hypothetical protein